ncbi:ABC transporter ATP-binding protein [Verminephrobacter eiseniae]|uniref:ABC transporter related n=1 Tax=Verminephrobacter eiseniae (strain EF01-2) TaxID=391735 RepID=A1WG63_VEREI|nr:ABC transporter ATP-binding protein [Verminephrobacter eiseniae]ABM56620.1 ABC transporter related [Verminephrobacter eiseniae EF01-2]MCW5286977.1 ABC transporter ATP-binding protein [Verminephrobacter eiseniae]MCW5305275.1 ABC transporter ATP-binding protein [Verminephrobacter eiseniae]MCW8179250.1 ABC transporter ATP-binding protein [Verminephrobacter eiseniae]MCW8191670.1 ABC transporter ATP-binding protein [Verminephrobacter eiseniae]
MRQSPLIPRPKPARGALLLEICALTKRFGSFTAIDQVSLKVEPGSVHALLGENGAGKSTLVKCVAGFARADAGSILIDGREQDIAHPVNARALGIGMVYQHFTLAPGMSVAENLLLAADRLPWVLDWKTRHAELRAFLQSTPFSLNLDACPADLAAGEKQKLELLKQLYLQPRLLILDEPTSVLTPQEADQVLAHIRDFAHRGACTVIIITHKFREVMAYADSVTVLRKGRAVHHGRVADTSPTLLAQAMVADGMAAAARPAAARAYPRPARHPSTTPATPALAVQDLCALGERGTLALRGLSLTLAHGEILGIAGVSGNGQRELLQALVGQRPRLSGSVSVMGQPYQATRRQNRQLKVRSLPEEPLRNACVAAFSVAENMALRDFDQAPLAVGGWLRFAAWRERARAWIAEYGIATRGETAAIGSLSGGNVQRAVLARELAGDINVLIAANPVFGLDFAAVAQIHSRLRQARERNAGVLLISEDLDELLELADRIVVMSEGRIVFETRAAAADRQVLGAHMGGGAAPDAQGVDTAPDAQVVDTALDAQIVDTAPDAQGAGAAHGRSRRVAA